MLLKFIDFTRFKNKKEVGSSSLWTKSTVFPSLVSTILGQYNGYSNNDSISDNLISSQSCVMSCLGFVIILQIFWENQRNVNDTPA